MEEDVREEEAEAGPWEAEMRERGDGREERRVVVEEHELGVGGRGQADGLEEEGELVERVEGEMAAEEGGEVGGGEGTGDGWDSGEEGEEGARGEGGYGVGVRGGEAARGDEVVGDGGAGSGDSGAAEAVG